MYKTMKYIGILLICLPLLVLWVQGAAMLFVLIAMVMAGCDAGRPH